MRVHFWGGAGTVTGSKFMVEHQDYNILVDCGMFQGIKALRELNRELLPIEPSQIDVVLLTHGHLDHCGWLPILVRQGFKGKIYCTAPSKQITRLILADSAKIQEEEAEKANKERYSKHNPALALYTTEEAERVTSHFRVVSPNDKIKLTDDIYFSFFTSGHIIGACSISLEIEEKTLVFSGDIGQHDDLLLESPVKPQKADYVFLESTYGNRLHPKNDLLLEIEMIINETYEKGGNVIIPSFAVERAQVVMYLIWQLKKEKRIPDIPYIVDSPMAAQVLEIFIENHKWHKLTPYECAEMMKQFTIITDFKDTIDAIFDERPKVVIAASGMITGGRVLSYLERYISKPENTVMLVGYQAEETRGRKLLDGAEEIKFYGKYYPVNAKTILVEGLSAHGDQQDLLDWLSKIKNQPQKVFLIHGEDEAVEVLKDKITEQYGWDVEIPLLGDVFEL
ncbi:MAG TPA: MBL fold metallo-hydrolase [Flavobacterium sp.]|nr:MBL fold metallo-hydrolase [Flavobacterium sp.]